MTDFDNKVVIVTGSARGIGKEIAAAFIAEGAKVVISDVNAEACAATAKEFGDRAAAIPANVTVKSEVENLVKQTQEKLGGLDIVVNNAGVTRDGLFVRMKEEDWDLVLNINLKGTFLMSQAAAPVLMKQRSGKIVNIASVSGLFGNYGQANYASSKGGIVALTKVMARELAPRNVNVNAVAPGFIVTAMTDKLTDEIKTSINKQIPFGRMGQVKDIADAVLFLASERASYITGQTIAVCGGLTMQS
ncbi:3-oxoacyl-[acyl-carrier-protein] reductase [Candidatus Termititenax persephonae]|uniref:3-oxoacyl-[acyl-carrier-protein] reductase n=1 Tax=Candidatus Termititenax persephonae TaxID=2218525 RepID=A0A388TI40_9BACT|nr:3-oxoacyl-[acyl-carrier-protein] reductase [Candidatus Termititenax persephonae]